MKKKHASENESMMERRYAEVNGIRLFYLDTVAGEKTIVCLHGRWGRGQTWRELMLHFQQHYRIIAPDQRGHGLSDKPRSKYTAEIMAEDIVRLVRKLKCDPVILIGHSMGARTAIAFAAHYPEYTRALVILDQPSQDPTIQYFESEEGEPLDPLMKDWPLPFPTLDDAIIHLRTQFPRISNQLYFLEGLIETENGYEFLSSPYAMGAISRDYQHVDALLPLIACPVLLVRAAESWNLFPEEAQRMRRLIKNCTYAEIKGSDHAVYADNPEQFYPLLKQFLDTLP